MVTGTMQYIDLVKDMVLRRKFNCCRIYKNMDNKLSLDVNSASLPIYIDFKIFFFSYLVGVLGTVYRSHMFIVYSFGTGLHAALRFMSKTQKKSYVAFPC